MFSYRAVKIDIFKFIEIGLSVFSPGINKFIGSPLCWGTFSGNYGIIYLHKLTA